MISKMLHCFKPPRSSNKVFADHANLLYTHKNILFFSDVNKELNNINEWFVSKKLSLNVEKMKYTLFSTET